MTAPSRRVALALGIADLVCAAVLVLGVFRGLPARYVWVDVPAGLLAVMQASAGASLLLGKPWALAVARVASAATLLSGMTLVTLLAISASWLAGVYGAVGGGGALLVCLVLALLLPYLIVLPAVQLLLLGPQGTART